MIARYFRLRLTAYTNIRSTSKERNVLLRILFISLLICFDWSKTILAEKFGGYLLLSSFILPLISLISSRVFIPLSAVKLILTVLRPFILLYDVGSFSLYVIFAKSLSLTILPATFLTGRDSKLPPLASVLKIIAVPSTLPIRTSLPENFSMAL